MPKLFGEKLNYDIHCSHCGGTNERPLNWLMARSAIACDWCDCLVHLGMAVSRGIVAKISQSRGIAST